MAQTNMNKKENIDNTITDSFFHTLLFHYKLCMQKDTIDKNTKYYWKLKRITFTVQCYGITPSSAVYNDNKIIYINKATKHQTKDNSIK